MANRIRGTNQSLETKLRLEPHRTHRSQRRPNLVRTRRLRTQPRKDQHPGRMTWARTAPAPQKPAATAARPYRPTLFQILLANPNPLSSDPFGATDIEGLTANHRVHGTIELGLGLADDVLTRSPRRDMRQKQLAYARLCRNHAGLRARQMQSGRTIRRVCPGGLAEEDVCVASQLD